MGWLFVCFDLPVMTKIERRQASRFRKDLLNRGYFMLQNSVYVRTCVSYEKTEKYIKEIKSISPENGSICCFFITDKQWANAILIEKANYKNSDYAVKIGQNEPKQMTFW